MDAIWRVLDDKYGSNSEQLRNIQNAVDRGELALFLGAGISISAGIPGWPDLMRQLLLKSVEAEGNVDGIKLAAETHYHIHKQAPLILGYQIEKRMGEDFLSSVRELLYKTDRKSKIVDSIGLICERISLISRVITYNFDDLVERKFDELRVRYKTVTTRECRLDSNCVNVVHVHGYVPRTEEKNESENIILGESSYHRLYNKPFDWTNAIQLTTLAQFRGLFVGFSFNDPNLRRLLQISQETNPGTKHFAILRRLNRRDLDGPVEGVCDSRTESSVQMERRKSELIAGLSDQADILYSLHKELYESLSLEIVWVKRHEEIAEIIQGLAIGQYK